MIKVGITGGIGSGKSTIARELEKLGIPVYFSDDKAKYLMINNEDLKESIKDLFGEEAYISPRSLNVKYLADKIFNDKNLMGQMNSLIHPVVMKDFHKWADEQSTGYVVLESAILIETGLYRELNQIMTVSVNQEDRIKRVMERNNLTREEVELKMKDQLSDAERERVAHVTIENTGDMDTIRDLADQIKTYLDGLL